jgi:hypothetical protein
MSQLKTIKNSHCLPENERTSSSSEQSKNLPAKEDLYLLLCVYETYTYYYIYKYTSISTAALYHLVSLRIRMTITFENDSDVIVYALEKIISFARENQYLFVANCIWWIAGVIGLDSGLTIFIDNLEIRKQIGENRISATPRDNARSESVDPEQLKIEETIIRNKNQNLARASRVTRSNPAVIQDPFPDPGASQYSQVKPLPTTKIQQKKARKVNRLQEANSKRETERNQRLTRLRATIFRSLNKE